MGLLNDYLYEGNMAKNEGPRAVEAIIDKENSFNTNETIDFSIENLPSLQEEEYNNFLKGISAERRYFPTSNNDQLPLTKVQLLQNFVNFYSEDYSSEEILAQVEKRWARADVVPTNIGDFSFNLSNYLTLSYYCSCDRGAKSSVFRKEWERYIDEMRKKINDARPSKKR